MLEGHGSRCRLLGIVRMSRVPGYAKELGWAGEEIQVTLHFIWDGVCVYSEGGRSCYSYSGNTLGGFKWYARGKRGLIAIKEPAGYLAHAQSALGAAEKEDLREVSWGSRREYTGGTT